MRSTRGWWQKWQEKQDGCQNWSPSRDAEIPGSPLFSLLPHCKAEGRGGLGSGWLLGAGPRWGMGAAQCWGEEGEDVSPSCRDSHGRDLARDTPAPAPAPPVSVGR